MQRLTLALLILCMAIVTVRIVAIGDWVAQDAAISFAYASHLAEGHGMVPFPGGERVEGYSNPTWVLLLAIGELLGMGPPWTAKGLGIACTALTIPLIFRIGRHASPTAPQAGGLGAAALFSLNAQVAFWGAAGLENSLFNLLLALGVALALDRRDRSSAAAFALLAITRPEALAYGLIAGAFIVRRMVGEGNRRAAAEWLLIVLCPVLGYQLIRYAYFAWELPAPAYARLDNESAMVLDWSGRAWHFLRSYAWGTHQWLWIPLSVIAVSGVRGWRLGVAGAGLLATAGLFYGAPRLISTPAITALVLDPARIGFIALAVVILALMAWTSEQRETRGVCMALLLGTLAFTLYAGGDWMRGHRWMAMLAVPATVLIASGCVELVSRIPTYADRAAIAAVVLATAGYGWTQQDYLDAVHAKMDVHPLSLRERVRTIDHDLDALHVQGHRVIATQDMGGFLLWSDIEVLDGIGLTDIPIARNGRGNWPEFAQQYFLEEKRPHIVRMGSAPNPPWVAPRWAEHYVRTVEGVEIRRDLLFDPVWQLGGSAVALEGTTLTGWEVPAPEVVAGGSMFLELGLRNDDRRELAIVAFLIREEQDEVAARWRLPLDLPTASWEPGDVYHGRYTVQIPAGLSPGSYRLGLAMRNRATFNGPVGALPKGVRSPDQALVFQGELWLDTTIEIVPTERADAATARDRQLALELAAAGSCSEAERAQFTAGRHGTALSATPDHRVIEGLAVCWATRTDPDPARRTANLIRAGWHDREAPGVAEAIEARIAQLTEVAQGSRATSLDVFQAYRDIVALDPSRSWARRRTEEARAIVLAAQAPPPRRLRRSKGQKAKAISPP